MMMENKEEAVKKVQKMLSNIEVCKPVITFLFGLSNRTIYTHFEKKPWFAHLKSQSWGTIQDHLKTWLLSVKNTHWECRQLLNVLHCLYELHEGEFVRQVLGDQAKVAIRSIHLIRLDCWVLLYCLECLPIIRSLKLTECSLTPEKLQMLHPALSRCEELR